MSFAVFHPMSSLRIDTCTYSTSYQVDGTLSEFLILVWKFPALVRMVPALIRKSFGCSTRVVCLWSPPDFVRTLLDFIQIKGTILGWGAQHMSWGQSLSESVKLTPLRDCMHLCAWSLTVSVTYRSTWQYYNFHRALRLHTTVLKLTLLQYPAAIEG